MTTPNPELDPNHPANASSNRPVTDLMRELVTNVSDLVRQEFQLARAEAGEKVGSIINGVVAIASGLILALAALIILLDAIVYGLAKDTMPLWLSAVIVGGIVAVIAAILIGVGKSKLTATNLSPDRTTRNVRRDAEAVREHV